MSSTYIYTHTHKLYIYKLTTLNVASFANPLGPGDPREFPQRQICEYLESDQEALSRSWGNLRDLVQLNRDRPHEKTPLNFGS